MSSNNIDESFYDEIVQQEAEKIVISEKPIDLEKKQDKLPSKETKLSSNYINGWINTLFNLAKAASNFGMKLPIELNSMKSICDYIKNAVQITFEFFYSPIILFWLGLNTLFHFSGFNTKLSIFLCFASFCFILFPNLNRQFQWFLSFYYNDHLKLFMSEFWIDNLTKLYNSPLVNLTSESTLFNKIPYLMMLSALNYLCSEISENYILIWFFQLNSIFILQKSPHLFFQCLVAYFLNILSMLFFGTGLMTLLVSLEIIFLRNQNKKLENFSKKEWIVFAFFLVGFLSNLMWSDWTSTGTMFSLNIMVCQFWTIAWYLFVNFEFQYEQSLLIYSILSFCIAIQHPFLLVIHFIATMHYVFKPIIFLFGK